MRAATIYTALLHAYPAPFRHEYGREMALAFAEQIRDARRRKARGDELTLWLHAARDLVTIAPREHAAVIHHDLRLAVRTTIAKPAFAIVAILSLALGIGANTAIFSLWNGVRHASLPGVAHPEQLVILTDPTTSGSWRGTWNTRLDGPRNWATYPEFEQLRDHAWAFASLMASEASLATWQARIDGPALEDVHGRLVSGAFFDVLGVRPALGELFTSADDAGQPIFIPFTLDARLAVFLVVITVLAALTFTVLPAWQLMTDDAVASFDDAHRRTIGSRRELRSCRWLVAAQLALSLPLLVGAGLLVRTAVNLQHPSLGFRSQGLLLARVSLGELVRDPARRDRMLRELTARVERIPGVRLATYSQLGVLGGGRSLGPIEVDGTTLPNNRDVPFDRVAANYFTTLGVPVRQGRDLADADTSDGPRVCVVNEAFARTYLAGRRPLGMHVTVIEADGARRPYEIVGIVADARIHELRGDVQPRFFVAAEQRRSMSGSRTFMISTASSSIAITNAIRDALTTADPSIALSELVSMDAHLSELTADERAVAQLATTFGVLALALAAIGLFGVLSYSVTRRSREIAVRIALGAPDRAVVSMILRETLALILAGTVLGGMLALACGSVIAARLYGVAPHDPTTLATAIVVLLIVACGAAYLPARRASSGDPSTVLQQS